MLMIKLKKDYVLGRHDFISPITFKSITNSILYNSIISKQTSSKKTNILINLIRIFNIII